MSHRSVPHATEWQVNAKEQTAGRVVSIPQGMTITEGLRVIGGYTAQELDQIAHEHPEKLERGSLFSLRRHTRALRDPHMS
jgi:hypothetical protein